MKRALFVMFGVMAGMAWAEGARPWEGAVTLAAYSKTAMSITGDIALSGPEDARVVAFASGASAVLQPVGTVQGSWSLSGSEVLDGAVFAVQADPGALVNGNSLCGAEMPARFIVFTEEADFVQMAVFSGDQPSGIDAPGLCGTYNFTAG